MQEEWNRGAIDCYEYIVLSLVDMYVEYMIIFILNQINKGN